MRKALFFLSVVLIIIQFSNSASAWDTTAAKFYPLQVGNSYTYYNYEHYVDCSSVLSGKIRVTITGETILSNGKKYFVFTSQPGGGVQYQRIDSATMNVWSYDIVNNKEVLFDSLLASIGNSFNSARFTVGAPRARFNGSSTHNVLGRMREEKFYSISYSISFLSYSLLEGIGYTGFGYCIDWGSSSDLKGCVVNGVLYGDTVTTIIQQISSEVPDKFSLSQNYPNPFNPETNIKFALLKSGEVKLTVFDALGKEISVLVNEFKTQGVYTATFDAANFPSGTYYYKLETDNFSEVKKMILLK